MLTDAVATGREVVVPITTPASIVAVGPDAATWRAVKKRRWQAQLERSEERISMLERNVADG